MNAILPLWKAWKGLSMIASVVSKSHCWFFSDWLGKGMYTLNTVVQVKKIHFTFRLGCQYIKLEKKFSYYLRPSHPHTVSLYCCAVGGPK